MKKSESNGLDRNRKLDSSQIRAVDCSRVQNVQEVLEDEYGVHIESAINVQLGFSSLLS